MTQTTALPVTAADVLEVAGSVWDSFLGLVLEPAAPGAVPAPDVMTGVVGISGAWQGSVALRCSRAHATAAAEAMFAAATGSLGAAEVDDALGELTNIVGGNLKSLLPEPSALATPSVLSGSPDLLASRLVLEVALRTGPEVVLVSVWQA